MMGDPYNTESRLDLADDDAALPWLDTGDDEVEARSPSILPYALMALLALAALVGGIWWATNRSTASEVVADGSVVAAPPGPYKVRPSDPGGKEFAGTGDVAPVIAEGGTREGQLAQRDAPRPAIERATASPAPTAAPSATEAPAAPGIGVQVGAYSNRETAEAGWASLVRQTEALAGVRHRIVQGQADIGTVYRLQAVAGNEASARALCDALKADGIACQVKR